MMPSRKCKRNNTKIPPEACVLCKTDVDNELLFGELFHADDLSAHYYCLLFSSGLAQNGEPSVDFNGFLLEDVKKEVCRGQYLKCSYCRQAGATIGCCVKRCKKVFHLHCGQKHNSRQEFFGNFASYCKNHKINQDISEDEKQTDTICAICCTAIVLNNLDSYLHSSCCTSNWFHRICLQTYALNAGYYFKCPICNDTGKFREEMILYGIHVPDQDASWEMEENAYGDLLFHPQCSASPCICPWGKSLNRKHTLWHLLCCQDCGSTSVHAGCANLTLDCIFWKCSECVEIANRCSNALVADDRNDGGVHQWNTTGQCRLLGLKPSTTCPVTGVRPGRAGSSPVFCIVRGKRFPLDRRPRLGRAAGHHTLLSHHGDRGISSWTSSEARAPIPRAPRRSREAIWTPACHGSKSLHYALALRNWRRRRGFWRHWPTREHLSQICSARDLEQCHLSFCGSVPAGLQKWTPRVFSSLWSLLVQPP